MKNSAAGGGGFLLFTLGGVPSTQSCVPDCVGNKGRPNKPFPPPPPTCQCLVNNHGTPSGGVNEFCVGASVAHAATPYGPWTQYPNVVPKATNPSAVVFENGTVLLAARHSAISVHDPCSLHIYVADDYRGPYRLVNNCTGVSEDPFLWRDARGFHILTHVKQGEYPTWYADFGGVFSSPDGISWRGPAREYAYNTTVANGWAGRGGNTTLSARQRPFLLVENSTRYLFNAVGLPGIDHWSFGCNFVQQVDMSP